jgi:hypothetical protein
MKHQTTLAWAAIGLFFIAASQVMAEDAPPTYKGDPSVYKVIFEDQNFRVIEAIRKKGVHDKLHSHPVPSIIYNVSDCTTQQYNADGKPQGSASVVKAGTARQAPITAGHSAENVGQNDCHQIFVERK